VVSIAHSLQQIAFALLSQQPESYFPEVPRAREVYGTLTLVVTIIAVLLLSAVIVGRLATMFSEEVIPLGHLVTGIVAVICVAVYVFTRVGKTDALIVGAGALILFLLYQRTVESREKEYARGRGLVLPKVEGQPWSKVTKRREEERALERWEEETEAEEYYARCQYCGQEVLIRKGKCLNCGQQVSERRES